MKAYYDNKEYELTKELIDELQDKAYRMSDGFSNFVLSVDWDDEHDCPRFFFDGPWEC